MLDVARGAGRQSSKRVSLEPLRERFEDASLNGWHLLDHPAERAICQDEKSRLRRCHDGCGSWSAGNQSDLAEKVPVAEPIDWLAFLRDLCRTFDDHDELASGRPLSRKGSALGNRQLIGLCGERSQLCFGASGEERHLLNELNLCVLVELHIGDRSLRGFKFPRGVCATICGEGIGIERMRRLSGAAVSCTGSRARIDLHADAWSRRWLVVGLAEPDEVAGSNAETLGGIGGIAADDREPASWVDH